MTIGSISSRPCAGYSPSVTDLPTRNESHPIPWPVTNSGERSLPGSPIILKWTPDQIAITLGTPEEAGYWIIGVELFNTGELIITTLDISDKPNVFASRMVSQDFIRRLPPGSGQSPPLYTDDLGQLLKLVSLIRKGSSPQGEGPSERMRNQMDVRDIEMYLNKLIERYRDEAPKSPQRSEPADQRLV